MEPQKDPQIAPAIIQAILAQASARGLSVDEYLAQLLGLTNGHYPEDELQAAAIDDDVLLGVFDSTEPYERPKRKERDAFGKGVVAKLERQGLKLP